MKTGIKDIDIQHKELFHRIENLTLSLYNGNKLETVRMMQFLEEYTESHFLLEESLFKNSMYPVCDVHVREHDKFRVELP